MATILIVEDNKDCALVFKRFAIASSHIPILARNGHEGIQEWNNNTIDLVVTDIDMPKMTGLELLKELDGKAKVVVITGDKERHYDEAKSLSALEVIEKPISLIRFKELVDRYT